MIFRTIAGDIGDLNRPKFRDEDVSQRQIIVVEILVGEIDHARDDLNSEMKKISGVHRFHLLKHIFVQIEMIETFVDHKGECVVRLKAHAQ